MICNWKSWAVAGFLVTYMLVDPRGAAHTAHQGFGGLKSAGTSFSTFGKALGDE